MAILLASPVSANAIGFEAESAYASVFVVYSGNSLGSGFAIGENCIVTNAHVIADNDHITIISYDGDEFEAAILGISEDEDIAVLVVDNITFPYLPVADLSSMKTGDVVAYILSRPTACKYQRKSEPGAHEFLSHQRPRKSEPLRSRIFEPPC